VPKKSERFTDTVEGSGSLFKKKSTILFAFRKKQQSLYYSAICFRKTSLFYAEIVVTADVPCRASSAI